MDGLLAVFLGLAAFIIIFAYLGLACHYIESREGTMPGWLVYLAYVVFTMIIPFIIFHKMGLLAE